MRHRNLLHGLCVLSLATSVSASAAPVVYHGICDASAAVMLDKDRFVVADDEDNILRIYSIAAPGDPVKVDLAQLLGGKKEADIEGAARIDERIYWITSHGASKDGEERPARRRFFATDIVTGAGGVDVQAAGMASGEISRLFGSATGQAYGLAAKAKNAPEAADGLNIEGLAATPKGGVLIGFRNPIPHGRALIVPLKNPSKLVDKSPEAPKFGAPIEIDLGGLGIRSIELVPGTADYIIVAGAAGKGNFSLYRWREGQKPVQLKADIPPDFRPEALMFDPGRKVMHLLSDDGDECKSKDTKPKTFRLLTLPMPTW